MSADGYILSGHRRHAASRHLSLERIPVRIRADVSYDRDADEFLRLLASFNRQRVKNTAEQLREEVVLMADDSCCQVRRFRRSAASVDAEGVDLGKRRRRSAIRDKLQLRAAMVKAVMDEQRNWPLSDRAVFYRLLNIKGLVRNDRTRLKFENSEAFNDDVTNMLTRLRLDGSIPFESIADETRPVVIWDTHRCVGDFVRRECDQFLMGYWRNLMQSQYIWLELLVEKNTIASQLRGVTGKYTVPMSSGRGYSSLRPRTDMVDRFRQSGRERLVVIVVSDHDPEGADIPGSFGVSLRDDFNVAPDQLRIIKAALTAEQVRTMNLHEEVHQSLAGFLAPPLAGLLGGGLGGRFRWGGFRFAVRGEPSAVRLCEPRLRTLCPCPVGTSATCRRWRTRNGKRERFRASSPSARHISRRPSTSHGLGTI